MRVLIISNVFPPGFIGGYELGALDVARGLMNRGHSVRVLTSDYFVDDLSEITDLDVSRTLEFVEPSQLRRAADALWLGSFIYPQNIRRIGSEVIAFSPDAVLVFNCLGLGVIGLIRFLASVGLPPVLYLMDDIFVHMRNADFRDSARAAVGGLSFLSDLEIVVMAKGLQAQIEESLGMSISPVVIPGWPTIGSCEQPVLPTKPDGDRIRFVYSSRVAGHKGIDVLIDAAKLLCEGSNRHFTVDVYGTGETTQFLQRVTALGIGEQIRYRGLLSKPEMAQRFRDYDALLFPTWEREPFGFVVPEAAFAGCIPIMTAGIGAGEWFFDGIDCLKIRREPSGLAAAMLQLMLMSTQDRQAFQARSAETGRRFFRFDRAIEKVEMLLEAAARRGRKPDPEKIRGCEAALMLLEDLGSARRRV